MPKWVAFVGISYNIMTVLYVNRGDSYLSRVCCVLYARPLIFNIIDFGKVSNMEMFFLKILNGHVHNQK